MTEKDNQQKKSQKQDTEQKSQIHIEDIDKLANINHTKKRRKTKIKKDDFQQNSFEKTTNEQLNVANLHANNAKLPVFSQPLVKKKKSYKLLYSFIIFFIVPFFLFLFYYGFLATDRYGSTAGFSVRSIDSSESLDGLGAVTGLVSATSTITDSYIVLDYLKSRSLIETLDQRLDLKSVYTNEDIDWLSRLNAKVVVEDFVDYWQSRISTEFNPTTSIIEFTVQSFSAEHALKIAELTLELTQQLINNLSEQARQDVLKFSQQEVSIQEARLRKALENLRVFRTFEMSVDPSATASLDIQLIGKLEEQLIDLKAQIAVQEKFLNNNAPSLVALRTQAQALAEQISQRRAGITGNNQDLQRATATTKQLNEFESLNIEKQFAEQAYASALSSLEQARSDADAKQRYLAIHLYPKLAEKAEYPRRLRNILVAGFCLFAIWGIGALISYSVKDHFT